ncbi:MAG: cadherin repeat domain-containing protein, partial [Planctomycetota bacterium]
AGAIDYETSTSHSITVRATSADGSFSTQVFTIQVNDVNEGAVGPVTDVNATANFVIENSANGTLVGLTGLATDPDGSDTVSYSLDDNAGGRFTIDSSTGVVTVAGGIDREAAGSYNIIIRATSSDASFSTQSFTISIGDVDEFDVTPVVDVNSTANSLAENSANGTLVGITASATDQDATTNTVNYSLDDNSGGRFAINSSTGVVSVANGSLLNYEAATSHSITIRATSADGSFTTQSFAINLTDFDEYDVSAVSDINPAANSVAENASAGTTVGLTAFAADSDATNNTITYTLTDNDGGRFAIDSSTGAVTTTRGLDRELDGAVRQVTIRATSADGSWSEETFTIDIQDQDEFDVTTPADVNSSPNFVAENSAAGSAVGITAQAADTDATTNLVSYSLTNNDGGRFAIDPVSGVVTTTRTLDREVDGAQRQVTVRATSADGSFAEQNFTIDIGDLDEFDVTAPADVNAASNFVAENSPAGSLVGITAQAADSDSTNNLVTYSLSNNDGGRFAIDPVSGVVTTTRALDREIDGASRQITIRSTSADGSTAEQVFTISIGDVDEADVTVPVDVNPSANQVNENAAIGSAVGLTISAQDSDATQSLVSYQLLDNAGGRFAIDALTGVVTVAGPLDYETATTHSILVRAISQDGSVANQYFTINVLPLNDNTPQFVSPTSYTVGENQLNVGFVSGTDADLPGQALSYTISGG